MKKLAIFVRVLSIVILFVIFLASAYASFFTDVATVRILVFAGVGLLCGVGLYSRITAVKAFGLAIEAAAEEAYADAEQIKAIRQEVEAQKDSIALITREANAAREQLNDVERIAQDACARAKHAQTLACQAEETAEEANTRIENLIEAIEREEQRARANRLM